MEELKLILDTISQTTGAAKQFGFLWLGLEALKSILCYLLIFVVFLLAYKVSNRLVGVLQDNSFASSLRAIISPRADFGLLTAHEKADIMDAVKRGISNTNDK